MNNRLFNPFEKMDCDLIPLRIRIQTLNNCVPDGYKSRMKRFKGFFFALLVSIAIISLSGCTNDPVKIALRTSNGHKGITAVQQLTDQSILTKVALEANRSDVRETAVDKLTDQSSLEKVAMEDRYYKVREAAINKVTDQSLLAKIAMEDEDLNVREAAINKVTDQSLLAKIAMEAIWYKEQEAATNKVTDQSLLAKIAMEASWHKVFEAAIKNLTDPAMLAKIAIEDENLNVRKAAVEKLTDSVMLASLANINGDMRIQLIYKLILAFDNVPFKHRVRLISGILPAIHVLSDPEVYNIVGEIVSVRTDWSSRSQYYSGASLSGSADGELFKCSIKLKNLPGSSWHTWSTNFTTITSDLRFQSATIKAGDLLGPTFEWLPQVLLTKIAIENKNSTVREAAVKILTDPAMLAKIAMEDEAFNVCKAAVEKLTDSAMLAKIAMDESLSVRDFAIGKLTDQSLLAKIAIDGKGQLTRKAAIRRLTDQSTLAKIAKEEKDTWVRIAA